MIEDEVRQNDDVERTACDKIRRIGPPDKPLDGRLLFRLFGEIGLDVEAQVVDESGIRIVCDDDLAGLIGCSDETGEASSGTKLEDTFILADLVTMSV